MPGMSLKGPKGSPPSSLLRITNHTRRKFMRGGIREGNRLSQRKREGKQKKKNYTSPE
jgi:hypothetical protein